LNAWQEPEVLVVELLKQLLEVVPADQAAIVLLRRSGGGDPAITGWNRRSNSPGPVSVSRTLITSAITGSTAIFSDDVTSNEELSDASSLTRRRINSVIVVPLIPNGKTIGAVYLDSSDTVNQLTRNDLEFVALVAEYAGTTLEGAQKLIALKEENGRLQSALRLRHNLIGFSASMQRISDRIAKIARTDATVMIRGETGTGKELAARAIHQNSARVAQPFEAINCSLLRDTLLESELFGHEKGAFTGAVAQKKGKLELADGGTLFLDELAELGESPQAMLLRVLQTREFQRLGGTRTLRVDLRIIAATNENLEEAVQRKAFRQDLYYRLNVVSLTMPPLRERREDIPLLADHFLQIYSRKNKRLVKCVSSEAATFLVQYDWPGNVRELENTIEHAVVFGLTDQIIPEDLPDTLLAFCAADADESLKYHDAVREAKRNIVLSAMQKASGNHAEAAKLLGLHVNNLYRLVRELDLKSKLEGVSRLASANQNRQ
jgi:Nif-specific regulatory protein